MQIKNNFISTICLGNFNPSILTSAFLTDKCKLKFEEKPEGNTTPIVASIKYGNIQFIVELEKFQIVEKNIADFHKTKIIDYFEKYITILEYTPIFICGVNLNTTMSDYNESKLNEILKSYDHIFNIFKADEMVIDKKEIINKSNSAEEWLAYNFVCSGGNNTITRLNLKKTKDTSIIVNFNFEIKNLEKEKERIKTIGRKIENLIQEHGNIIKEFF